MKTVNPHRHAAALAVWVALVLLSGLFAQDQFDLSKLPLVQHLQAFPIRPALGDPNTPAKFGRDGPKGVATGDFNSDDWPDVVVSNLDGILNVFLNLGGADLALKGDLRTGATSLREIIAHDLNGDGKTDLAVAAPFEEVIVLFWGNGDGTFSDAQPLGAWPGVRNLAAGDFEGDNVADLAAAFQWQKTGPATTPERIAARGGGDPGGGSQRGRTP